MWFSGVQIDEAEELLSRDYAAWWALYVQWKGGEQLDLSGFAHGWHEPIREAVRDLRDTADALDLVRAALRTYRNRERSAADKASGNCPKCGARGVFIRMALCCPQHGAYGGI